MCGATFLVGAKSYLLLKKHPLLGKTTFQIFPNDGRSFGKTSNHQTVLILVYVSGSFFGVLADQQHFCFEVVLFEGVGSSG